MSLLKFHPAIQAAIETNERKRITIEILKRPFQLEDVAIGEPVSMASMKDAQNKDKVPTDIWGDNLMLHYVRQTPAGTDSADEMSRHSVTPCAVKDAGGGQI